MNKPYRIGHSFENRIIAKLEKAGAILIHSAQSKFPDGEFCLNKQHFYFECKYNRKEGTKMLKDAEYKRACEIVEATKTPFIVISKQRHKNVISVVAVGGVGIFESMDIRNILNRRGEKFGKEKD